MALSDVLPYARTRMKNLGYQEWEDAFNPDEIPKSLADRTFHLEAGDAARLDSHQDNIHISMPFTIRIFQNWERLTIAGREAAIALSDTVIDDLIAAANRLTQSGIKTVEFDTMSIDELSEDNDNSAMITLTFTALVIKSTR